MSFTDGLQGVAGDPVRVAARPERWLLPVMGALVAGIALVMFTPRGEYASGVAVVQIDGRADIAAVEPALVAAVHVRPGQRVTAGQLLVELDARGVQAQYERFEREWELQLVKVLRDPGDVAAQRTLTALRAERDLQSARLEHRAVRAPRQGIVAGVWVQRGQSILPGNRLVSFVPESARPKLKIVLPGQALPHLGPGRLVRFSLEGFRFKYQTTVLDSVTQEIVSGPELRRTMGSEQADVVRGDGPFAVATASLPGPSFSDDGSAINYYPGMRASAWVRLRTQSIYRTLVPRR
jgi:multidrug resistance efflux pump